MGFFKPIKNLLDAHYKVLKKILGKGGTICFPTHSFSLVKSKKIFSVKDTQSETGVFTEYLRKKKDSIRQVHPFSSMSSIGKNAKFICGNNSKHAHGIETPFEKLIKLKAKIISIGIKPRFTCTQIHHAETVMNVPYRYTKEFQHKIKLKNGKIINDKFYLFVLYEYLRKLPRDKNKKIFFIFEKSNKVKKINCGKSYVYSYSINKFHENAINLMKKNPYVWMLKEPKKKIWNK